MNTSHLKLTGIAAILAVVALGSVYLFARPPAPGPSVGATSPSLAAVTSAVVAAIPAPALGTTSTQPKITWSTTSVQVILSPGESTSSDLTFTSSLALSNIVIEPVPAIAPFVSIQPNAFASVPANQPQSVHIALSIPAGTTLGTYDGTIHLRSGSTTYPQTLKVVVNVWAPLVSAAGGFSIKIPPQFTASTDPSTGAVRVQNFIPGDNHILAPGEMYIRVFRSTTERLGDVRSHIEVAKEFASNGGTVIRGDRSDSFLGPHFAFDEYLIRDDVVWVITGTYRPNDTSSLLVIERVMDSLQVP